MILGDAWRRILASTYERHGLAAIVTLVDELDRIGALNEVKDRVLAQTADEMSDVGAACTPPTSTGRRAVTLMWLEDVLGDGPMRVVELRVAAEDAGISWRTVESLKAEAGAVAEQRRREWWWTNPPPMPNGLATAGPSATQTAQTARRAITA